VTPVPDVQPTDVERLIDAMVKPLVKIECTLSDKAPLRLDRKFIPERVLNVSSPDGTTRFHDGALYYMVSGSGTGHVVDMSDQPGQAGQITQFGGEITVIGPYLLFVGQLAPSARIHIQGGIGYSRLAPMDGGFGCKHIEFDGTHFLQPKLGAPRIEISDVSDGERAGLRNPDLIQKAVWKYDQREYVIFFRPGTKIVPGNHEERKVQFPEIYELIELDRKRQLTAPMIRDASLQQALR
jgi:hypothetical protein